MFMGSAAVIAVYTAGFLHTAKAAAKQAADERGPSGSSGRGGNGGGSRESVRPETAAPAPVPAVLATSAPKLPVTAPATPPPAAVPATLQTPTPAPVAVAPVVPAPAPVAPAVMTAVAPTAVPVVVNTPASPAPVPSTPVPVAAMPAAPAPAAAASVTATPVAAALPAKKYKDGAYFGWGSCRHGDLKVIVELKDDKIVSANIAECYTRYSKNVISRLPGQLVTRQKPEALDRVSGASESSDAYYYAVVEALKAAKM